MKIIQGGTAGIAAQFEEAGIEIAKAPEIVEVTPREEVVKPTVDPTDDTEDENGLTATDRAELTKKHQRAIGKKHAALREAEALAKTEYEGRRTAEERVEALKKELEDLKKAAEQPKAPVRPKRESFGTQEAYEDALLAYGREVDKAENAKKAITDGAEREKARQQAVINAANARIAHAREVVEDFDEVIGAADIVVPPHVGIAMQESDMLAELGYHFAKHPEELERLAKLSPARAVVEIGKIESKLQPFPAAKAGKAPNGTQPSVKDNGESKAETPEAKPNPTASAPSKRPAPVITPLPTGTGSQSADAPRTQKEHVEVFGKREGVNLYQRKRH